MNNEQFRKLLGADSAKSQSPSNGASQGSASPAASGALGSRQRSSIPMTPRSVGVGNSRSEFARQLAARNQATQPQKKFRTSTPKGSRLAEGYVDRARDRTDEEEDDRAKRIKALEEALKNEEIDQATFEKLCSEIAGGDLSSTHLIKGLDFKLLERVRKGEDVYGDKKDDEEEEVPPEEEVDEAFDELAETEVQAVEKEKVKKKGQFAPVALAPGKKRTRDQILAELKAAREAAKAQQEAALGNKFRKIGAKQQPGTRIERDSKGREVLIIVDEDGHEKRKVRKIQPGAEEEQRKEFVPDKDAKPLGMEVPEFYKKQQEEAEEDDNDDIFADAGDDYDPLAGMDDSSDDDSEGEVEDKKEAKDERSADTIAMPPPPRPVQARNYFKDAKTELISSQTLKGPSMSDPAIQAAFKRAALLNAANKDREGEEDDEDDEEAKARRERHKRMLQSVDRDAEDLDMGFGTSRFEDEADFDDAPVKLSEWGNDDDEGDGQGGKSKRKRGPKKRKGDANNAADVLRVMEQRKAASKS
ncbi:meiotic chromosome segregation protein C1539.02 [Colletotrichum spaethianum]|uniref:Meiotic chromosome segregation protein C1539.02 n=1 Tax=Colletotrichum spaethianum TaxID=700344 RepID=A0AA37L5B5_9PEZI|nr:meiotic chromosome segregation protein C1539.02 [Colletotrichum spaethianum]GKT42122.1 meiotic chromosome segregation protein C1539.02 [Colletotrichum spaethianum]